MCVGLKGELILSSQGGECFLAVLLKTAKDSLVLDS